MSFFIDPNGFWVDPNAQGHYYYGSPIYNPILCYLIAEFLKSEDLKTVIDIGCGTGRYVKGLREHGLQVEGYDGNPFTQKISAQVLGDGTFCKQLDFSQPVRFDEPADCILSLDVGEHIPAIYEDVFLDNVTINAKKCIVLSWAEETRDGVVHVNCHSNDYVILKMKERGFDEFEEAKMFIRSNTQLPWPQNAPMVFWNRKFQ